MRAAITKLSRIAQAPDNQRLLRELAFVYAEVTEVDVRTISWNRLILDRTNHRWQDLLTLARLFLLDRNQQTSAGAIDGHALLFEMNDLFEQYVARLVSRALAGSEFVVSVQGGRRDCLYEGEKGRFRTRPDIIIRHNDNITLVIDAKWKRMTPRIDDPKQGVSQADIYQLMAYSQIYNCKKVMLLYPHHSDLPENPVRQRYSIADQNAKEALFLSTLNLTGSRRDHRDALKKLIHDCLLDAAMV